MRFAPRAGGWSAPTAPPARPGWRRSDIPPPLWILPPRTPIVSTTGTPQAAMLLPSHTPPEACQPIAWPRSAPASRTSSNNRSISRRHRLWRAAEPAVHLDRHFALRRHRGHRLVDQPPRLIFLLRPARAQVDSQHGEVGNDVVRAAAVDPRRVDRQARRACARSSRSARSAAARMRVAPVLGVAPGMGRAAAHHQRVIGASRPRAGKRPVGKRRGLVGQRRLLAARRLRDQRRRARASRPPRRC